ncbi:MAG: hypothetical protein IT372_25710 [Polyangiaceae bacterium]|nr:hypothetical protein [Polyangiaceae bacterium]
MNKTAADAVSDLLLRSYETLHRSIDDVKLMATPEEHTHYCRLVGQILGDMFLDLLGPFYEQHIDLMPDFMRPLEPSNEESSAPWPPPRAARGGIPEHLEDLATEVDPSVLMDAVGSALQDALDLVCRDIGELNQADFRQGVDEVLVDLANAKDYLVSSGLGARVAAATGRSS